MGRTPFTFTIGKGAWVEEIRYFTSELSPNYWTRFRALNEDEIATIERGVNRQLPQDFKDFLQVFGAGWFPARFGGNIYEPEDLIAACHGHLWMILGSGDWASEEDQKTF